MRQAGNANKSTATSRVLRIGTIGVEKKLAIETFRVQREHPDANAQVWAMDEHPLGLKPVIRKVWV